MSEPNFRRCDSVCVLVDFSTERHESGVLFDDNGLKKTLLQLIQEKIGRKVGLRRDASICGLILGRMEGFLW